MSSPALTYTGPVWYSSSVNRTQHNGEPLDASFVDVNQLKAGNDPSSHAEGASYCSTLPAGAGQTTTVEVGREQST